MNNEDKESDEAFTEQFSNNVPEELKCVDAAIKYMKCNPTFKKMLEILNKARYNREI